MQLKTTVLNDKSKSKSSINYQLIIQLINYRFYTIFKENCRKTHSSRSLRNYRVCIYQKRKRRRE